MARSKERCRVRLAELLGCDYYDPRDHHRHRLSEWAGRGLCGADAGGSRVAGRARVRELLAGGAWGGGSTYHLTVNTTDREIKELAPAVADFASRWFRTQ